ARTTRAKRAHFTASSSIRGWFGTHITTSCRRSVRPSPRYFRKISPPPREPEPLLTRRIFILKCERCLRLKRPMTFESQRLVQRLRNRFIVALSRSVSVQTPKHLNPLFRPSFRGHIMRHFTRFRAPLACEIGIFGYFLHRAIEEVRVASNDSQAVDVVVDKIESRASRIRGDDWKTSGKGLIYHNAPPVIATR